MSLVLVLFEISEGALRASSAAAVGFAAQLAELQGGKFEILAVGHDAANVVEELAHYGAARVHVCNSRELSLSCAESLVPTVAAVARRAGATAVVATATAWGKDIMPRVAVGLDAGYISDCVGVGLSGGRLEYAKPLYAGNVIGTYVVETPVVALTVRQSAVPLAQPMALLPSEVVAVEHAAPSAAASRIEVLGVDVVESKRPDLVGARRVVAGGHGLGERFFEVLEPLADELDAAIGASRVACDIGHAPADLQVGQTGKVVAPELYVAVGISGAIQHTAGIRGAKVIVAVDKDAEAPIFSIADYGLVADAFEAIPQLVHKLRQHKQASR
jgi:electron transfer flavoprotein alpha subunit